MESAFELFYRILPSSIIAAVISAIIAAYLSSRLALRKFYSEKWWERKERAYVEIIDAFYDLIQYCEIQKNDYGQGTGFDEAKEREFRDRYNHAHWKIKRATDVGAFVVSLEAEIALKELRDRPRLAWEENPRWDIYEQDYKYYRETLDKIVRIAKRDLKGS